MKRFAIIILVLMMYSVCSAAYDNTPVEVVAGGSGYAATTVGGNAFYSGSTVLDGKNIILTSGLVSRLHIRLNHVSGGDCTAAIFKIIRMSIPGDPTSTGTEIGRIDLTDHVNAARPGGAVRFEYDSDTDYGGETVDVEAAGIQAQAGDYICWFFAGGDLTVVPYLYKVNVGSATSNYKVTGDLATGFALDSSTEDRFPYQDVYVKTAEKLLLANSTGFVKDDIVVLPSYTDQNYYIMFEGVAGVGANETVEFTFQYLNTTETYTDLGAVITLTESTDTVGFVASGQSTATGTHGGITGGTFDIHFWIDPVNDDVMMFITDKSYNVAMQNMSTCLKRQRATTDIEKLRQVEITQSAGTAVTVAKISVCRRPIVIVGDSYTAAEGPNHQLNNIGAYLDDVGTFTEQRYVINAGETGSQVLHPTNGMLKRFQSIDIAVAGLPSFDASGYRDAIYVFVCGLNDINAETFTGTTAATANAMGWQLAGGIMQMWGGARRGDAGSESSGLLWGGINDVIFAEQPPIIVANIAGAETQCNQALRACYDVLETVAPAMGIYYVPVFDEVDTSLLAGDIHMTTAGYEYVGDRIVSFYENGNLPSGSLVQIHSDTQSIRKRLGAK